MGGYNNLVQSAPSIWNGTYENVPLMHYAKCINKKLQNQDQGAITFI